jgi:hypothetical protein
MKIFKFTQGGDPFPETYFLSAGLRFNAAMGYEIFIKALCFEGLGIRAIKGEIIRLFATENLGLRDKISELFSMVETMGLSAEEFRVGWGYFSEQLALAANMNVIKTISISITENMALAESGSVAVNIVDYALTWRTRTRTNQVGYGATGYGQVTGYGDGVCVDVHHFIVKVYRLSDNSLRRTQVISIADQANPDNDAAFTYTWQMNLSDNNWQFQNSLRFEIYEVDMNGVYSPAADVDITPIPFL